MIAEAIEKILELVMDAKIDDQYNRQWIKSGIGYSMVQPPSPDCLKTNTLASVRDFFQMEEPESSYVIICNQRHVSIVTELLTACGKRSILLDASSPGSGFPFDQYIDIEEFVIKMQCHFVPSQAQKDIINFVSAIKTSEVRKSEDDGIAQKVSVENEIGRLESVKFDPIVKLAPYRYFREVEQVESVFLLRMRKCGDSLPQVALFEADAGEWKIRAMDIVQEHLREILPEGARIIC